MQKRRYKAKIGDKSYVIIGPGSTEHMAEVTNYLNEQLAQIKRLSPGITVEEASILLAFNSISSLTIATDSTKQNSEETKQVTESSEDLFAEKKEINSSDQVEELTNQNDQSEEE